MSREDFITWAEGAAVERDNTIKQLTFTPEEAARMLIIGQLKEKLNDR